MASQVICISNFAFKHNFRATNQTSYLDQARAYTNDQSYLSENPKIFNIDTKVAGNQLLLALEEDPDKTESFDQIAEFCNWYEGVLIKTTRGLAYPTKTKENLDF